MRWLKKNKPAGKMPALPVAGALLLTLMFFTACTMGPDYKSPDLPLPPAYRDAPTTPDDAAAPPTPNSELQTPNSLPFASLIWPSLYQDRTLQDLVREALRANKNILIAAARVEQAREIFRQSRSGLFPSVSANAAASRGRNQHSGVPAYNNAATTDDATLTLGAFWEIDLWGRVRRLDEAARARYLTTDETRRAVTLSLISDVATAYYQLLELDAELAIARRTSDAFANSLRIFDQRRGQGVASRLETSRAQAALSQAAAAVPELQRQIAITENQLSLLLGRPPGPIARTPRFPDADLISATIPPGLPADLIARRPDLRATEQNLRAANASIGANIAAYYPTIGLSAFLGRASPDLSEITSGAGNAWSLSANITQPIFQAGRLRSQTRQARAAFDEALHQHEQAVLSALVEVSNALISRTKHAETAAQQKQEVASLTDSVSVALERYGTGKASYYEVLEAQQQLYPAETAYARTRLNQILSTIQLYKSLGGGWTAAPVNE